MPNQKTTTSAAGWGLDLLAATAAALNQCTDLPAIHEAVLGAVCAALTTSTAAIVAVDQDRSMFLVDCCCGEWAGASGQRHALQAGMSREVFAGPHPYVNHNVHADPAFANLPYMRNTPCVVCAPLLVGERIIGLLAAGKASPFDANNMRLLVTLADMAAAALDRMAVLTTLEQRVAERTQALLTANAQLEQLSRHKDEFLATMSHELRTPLTAVLGLSEALDTGVYGQINERQQRALHVILDSGRHLLHLINGLLDLSRIEAGEAELVIETCSLDQVAQSCLSLIGDLVRSKQQQVAFDAPLPISLLADPRRMHQLILNLLSNATKFTPAQGTITLRLHGDEAPATVVIEVADTGIGIAEADQERIFQPFVQLDSSLSRHYAGTGLGLALVQRIASLHGGGVQVISRPGQGSRFLVTLPWRRPERQASATPPALQGT